MQKTGALRIWSKTLWVYGMPLLVTVLLNACAPLRGFPSDPTDAQMSSAAEQELVKIYYSSGMSDDQRRLVRNQIVSGRINAYENSYSGFKRRLNGDSNTLNLGADLGVLILSGLAATTGNIATATALAAASAGVIGARGVVNSDLYFQRTLPALLAQMDANRAVAKLPIVKGLRLPDAGYPLAIALIDLDALRDAGGIPTAIGGLTQQAEAVKADAEQTLSGSIVHDPSIATASTLMRFKELDKRLKYLGGVGQVSVANVMIPVLTSRKPEVQAGMRQLIPTSGKFEVNQQRQATTFNNAWLDREDDLTGLSYEQWDKAIKSAGG